MNNTPKVLILMSTYNGGERIIGQANSILDQSDVDVHLLIRDDGSDQYTRTIIYQFVEAHPLKTRIIFGENIGWKKSFMELVYSAENGYDYYGFSDQDDIWLNNKIIRCIDSMNDGQCGIKLARCKPISTDEELKEKKVQEKYLEIPKSYKRVIATEFFQGCSMLWNAEAMGLIQSYKIKNSHLAHDYWVGVVCYICGTIHSCDEGLLFHIRYNENTSQDGNIWLGRFRRIIDFFTKTTVYMNPSEDLLDGMSQYLCDSQIKFLNHLRDYRNNYVAKKNLLLDCDFRRPSFASTILFKMAILFNRL